MRGAVAVLLLVGLAGPVAGRAAEVTSTPYGRLKDGREVRQITLRNDRGMEVRLINYGAIVTDVIVPDGRGHRENVVLGFGTLADYEAKNGNYGFGAAIGRFAGRIANARFSIDGKPVLLTANDRANALHGGPGGLDTKVWAMRPIRTGRKVGAELSYASPAGEQGFPGRLDLTITYRLLADNSLKIEYRATTDAPTALNLTNHSYFNLAGAGSGTIRDHRLQIASSRLIETRGDGIPTGGFLSVNDTPFDFRRPVAIGPMLDRHHSQMEGRGGFNHGWLLDRKPEIGLAARLIDPASGRRLEILTSEPSLHVYAANWFSGRDLGAQGQLYPRHAGIALETQHLPDAPNQPGFPTTILRPGETFRSTTIFRFSASKR